MISYKLAKENALKVLNDPKYQEIFNYDKLLANFEEETNHYGQNSLIEYKTKNLRIVKMSNNRFNKITLDEIINFQNYYNTKIFKKCKGNNNYFLVWVMVFNGKEIIQKYNNWDSFLEFAIIPGDDNIAFIDDEREDNKSACACTKGLNGGIIKKFFACKNPENGHMTVLGSSCVDKYLDLLNKNINDIDKRRQIEETRNRFRKIKSCKEFCKTCKISCKKDYCNKNCKNINQINNKYNESLKEKFPLYVSPPLTFTSSLDFDGPRRNEYGFKNINKSENYINDTSINKEIYKQWNESYNKDEWVNYTRDNYNKLKSNKYELNKKLIKAEDENLDFSIIYQIGKNNKIYIHKIILFDEYVKKVKYITQEEAKESVEEEFKNLSLEKNNHDDNVENEIVAYAI